MTGRRIAYAIVLAGAFAFWIYYDGRISVYLFFIVLALPVFSLLASLPFLGKPHARISSPLTVARGGETELSFSILVRGNICILPGVICVTFCDLMEDRTEKMTFYTPDSGSYVFSARHSGVRQAQIRKAWVTDFLGIWRFPAVLPPPSRLSVPPVPQKPVPAPDFYFLRMSTVKPKPGGGFSEIHELREYRPGDPLRSVHWKATAKTDSPVVREAQESVSARVLLTYALSGSRDEADRTLDRLAWVSGELLGLGIPHAAASRSGDQVHAIGVREDLDALLARLMSEKMPAFNADEDAALPPSDWTYRVTGDASSAPVSDGKEVGS